MGEQSRKGEEVSVDEEEMGGKQLYLKGPGRVKSTTLADNAESVFCARPQLHPAQTPRKGIFWPTPTAHPQTTAVKIAA